MTVSFDHMVLTLALIGPLFGLIDCIVKKPVHGRLLSLVGWLLMIWLPGVFFPENVWSVLLPAGLIAVAIYFVGGFHKRDVPKGESTVLFFSQPSSVALAGALAGLVLALFFYAVGLMGHPEDFPSNVRWMLLVFPLVIGGILGVLKKHIRRRYPEPLPISFAFGSGSQGAFTNPMSAGREMAAPGGIMLDELLISIMLTPISWPMLGSLFPPWNLFHLYGLIILPTLVVYIAWSTLHRAFLRWTAKINRSELKQFWAYEHLVFHDRLGPWLGELTITYDEDESAFVVSGILPERHMLVSLRKILTDIGGDADTSAVDIDPSLSPNPWFQLALVRQSVRQKREASSA